MKKIFRNYLIKLLWWQVNRLISKRKPIVIAVAGSVGKTTTKSAIAHVLSGSLKVKYQTGNYNDIVSVPSIFFGHYPKHVGNPFGWLLYVIKAEITLLQKYPYAVVIVELGVDKPGDMEEFAQYLKADWGVLTAIAAEHLEALNDIDTVAKEELGIAKIAKKLLVDIDSVPLQYRSQLHNALKISSEEGDVHYSLSGLNDDMMRQLTLSYDGEKKVVSTKLIGRQNIPSLLIACVLGRQLGLTDDSITTRLESFTPFPGRMNVLTGRNGAILIDDSYNASPEAVKSALDTLYEVNAKQKITILGQMNELGDQSQSLHEEVGLQCNPKQLDLVVTVGDDANKYLAAKAEALGCKVVRCSSPYHAGEIVSPLLTKRTAVLIKGSQGGIFLEEATKLLLANAQDARLLVRQSPEWQKTKQRYFKDVI